MTPLHQPKNVRTLRLLWAILKWIAVFVDPDSVYDAIALVWAVIARVLNL